MFIDHALIECIAGDGGNGCNSMIRAGRRNHLRTSGGYGGPGGSVSLQASPHVHTLLDFQLSKNFKAAHGKHGGSNDMSGAAGESLLLDVPEGTQVFDDETGFLMADLVRAGDRVLCAKGGAGGKGNHRHAIAQRGEPGENRRVRLELKVIADVGLVGLPNAGKSTLINRLSHARSKVAAYPFTTKEPVLGVLRNADGDGLVIADIPGLIEGASAGKGLGHRFLKHIERTKLFLMVVDLSALEGGDPVDHYRAVEKELAAYSPVFKKRPRLIVASKMDLQEARSNLPAFKKKVRKKIFPISAATGEGIRELTAAIFGIATPSLKS